MEAIDVQSARCRVSWRQRMTAGSPHRGTGFQPVGDVPVALSRRLNKQSRQRKLVEENFAYAIGYSLREVPEYRHHGQDARATFGIAAAGVSKTLTGKRPRIDFDPGVLECFHASYIRDFKFQI